MQDSFTYSLHSMIWNMDSIADRLLKERYGISFRKFYVLAVLSSCQPTTQANLASFLEQSEPAVSRSLGHLEAEGYVTLRVNPKRKRQNIVALSPAGTKLATEASVYLETILAETLERTGVDTASYTHDTHAINRSLEAFRAKLDQPHDPAN